MPVSGPRAVKGDRLPEHADPLEFRAKVGASIPRGRRPSGVEWVLAVRWVRSAGGVTGAPTGQIMYWPPLTDRVAPLTKLAWSLAR